MTLRRGILAAVIVFLCWMIYRAVGAGNPDLVDTLAWVLVVVLMLPMDRFKPDNVVKMLKTWKGKSDV